MRTSAGPRVTCGVIAVLGSMVAIAACARTPASTPPPSLSVATATASVAPSIAPSLGPAADPLVGTWTTGLVSCKQWDAAIAKAYSASEIAKYDKDPDTHTCPATFTIRFRGQHQVIFVNDEIGWDGLYRLKGSDEIESGDNCAYCWLYRYRISDDHLTIDLLKDGDAIDRVLDGIIQTGIYESTIFDRVP
jgi:hypothetical protein